MTDPAQREAVNRIHAGITQLVDRVAAEWGVRPVQVRRWWHDAHGTYLPGPKRVKPTRVRRGKSTCRPYSLSEPGGTRVTTGERISTFL